MDARPIGVFDSGVGGLTVLHECLVTMPHEDFVYLGDHARLPYGPRELGEVRGFAREIGLYLEAQDVKLIVVACNTATSAALPQLQETLAVPVIAVLTPEVHAAVQATRNRRIGLLATQATVDAGRYAELIAQLDAGVQLTAVACPRLVDLIEEDAYFEETLEAVREYAAPLKAADVDTVILGCTHYPMIRAMLQRVFGRDVTLVFSAEETARVVAETLARKGMENAPDREGSYRFLTTGEPEAFRLAGRRFLAVLDFEALGERTLWLDCDVLQADGGTRCASISGAWIAAHRALDRMGLSKALTDTISAVSVGIVGGAALLDLDYSEDSK